MIFLHIMHFCMGDHNKTADLFRFMNAKRLQQLSALVVEIPAESQQFIF